MVSLGCGREGWEGAHSWDISGWVCLQRSPGPGPGMQDTPAHLLQPWTLSTGQGKRASSGRKEFLFRRLSLGRQEGLCCVGENAGHWQGPGSTPWAAQCRVPRTSRVFRSQSGGGSHDSRGPFPGPETWLPI